MNKYALFIDGDNISPSYLESILREVSNEGEILIKRIYGDWTTPNMNGWKEKLFHHPIRAIQQFRSGDNATDNAIIMDAIEITHINTNINSICIVSTDSDFYSLALRLREKGFYVLGIGKKNAKSIWVNSCNKYTYLENIRSISEEKINDIEFNNDNGLLDISIIMDYAIENSLQQDDGTIRLSTLGATIRNRFPGFDPRDYNHKTLLEIVLELPDMMEIIQDGRNPPNYSIKIKDDSSEDNYLTGIIKRTLPGFGIISNEKGDYFYSLTNVIQNQRCKLKKGDTVNFFEIKAPDNTKNETAEKNGRAIKVRKAEK